MGCNCGGRKAGTSFVVTVPGQAPRTVASEAAAATIAAGHRGATIKPVRKQP